MSASFQKIYPVSFLEYHICGCFCGVYLVVLGSLMNLKDSRAMGQYVIETELLAELSSVVNKDS